MFSKTYLKHNTLGTWQPLHYRKSRSTTCVRLNVACGSPCTWTTNMRNCNLSLTECPQLSSLRVRVPAAGAMFRPDPRDSGMREGGPSSMEEELSRALAGLGCHLVATGISADGLFTKLLLSCSMSGRLSQTPVEQQ